MRIRRILVFYSNNFVLNKNFEGLKTYCLLFSPVQHSHCKSIQVHGLAVKSWEPKFDQWPPVRKQAQTKNPCKISQESCLLEIYLPFPSSPINKEGGTFLIKTLPSGTNQLTTFLTRNHHHYPGVKGSNSVRRNSPPSPAN